METEWRHTVQWSQRGYFIVDRSKKYEQAPYLTRRALIGHRGAHLDLAGATSLRDCLRTNCEMASRGRARLCS